jgi:hypothetical protein
VKAEGDLSYQKWVEGIKTGRTFVSSNAMIDFSVDAQLPGKLNHLEVTGTVEVNGEPR